MVASTYGVNRDFGEGKRPDLTKDEITAVQEISVVPAAEGVFHRTNLEATAVEARSLSVLSVLKCPKWVVI